ncbi:MAG: Proline--tRNA ligase [Myxococcota bacterium]|nr:Proline--tRNA ligase [Myxococcota bacterium]
MRYSQYFLPTSADTPSDAVVISHKLMLRAGMIRKLAAGIYTYMPFALRTIHKISNILREELNRAGAIELLMPAVQPAELWQESGRWSQYGPELLRFKDRKDGDFCFGPTHEEVITALVRSEIRSYRNLPVNLYQIQTKFRDEIRPRFGLMRGREFIMKDGYSFDADEAGAMVTYWKMYEAYRRIFHRCGLKFRPVEADTGNIGGSLSHEFQVLAESGEDALLNCGSCDYAANVEKASERNDAAAPDPAGFLPVETVDTPGMGRIEEVSAFLQRPPEQFIKMLVCLADGTPVAVLVRGDHELNPVKLKGLLGADAVEMADDAMVLSAAGAPAGFVGPIGLKGNLRLLADHAVRGVLNGVCGANQADKHRIHVNPGRDFQAEYADLRMARAGGRCPKCEGGVLEAHRGIEVGHVFYLGLKYSRAMKAQFLDAAGKENPFVMGCYGIGVTRTMAAAIEQNHDAHGVIWPMPIAPFHVILCPINPKKDEEAGRAADALYGELTQAGVEVLHDDRGERAGSMFADADLLGVPIRVAIGARGLKDGIVEIKRRNEAEPARVPLKEAARVVQDMIRQDLEKYA